MKTFSRHPERIRIWLNIAEYCRTQSNTYQPPPPTHGATLPPLPATNQPYTQPPPTQTAQPMYNPYSVPQPSVQQIAPPQAPTVFNPTANANYDRPVESLHSSASTKPPGILLNTLYRIMDQLVCLHI